jgi:hypothetical protein
MLASAVISPDGRYRYELRRQWAEGRPVLWIMLNPSTADAELDDPTIRRVIGFTRAWGYPGAVVVNLFAWRATDPAELLRAPRSEVSGPDNASVLERLMAEAGLVVCAWGGHRAATKLPHPLVRALAVASHKELWCLGKTASGAPRHPLYLKADTELVPF